MRLYLHGRNASVGLGPLTLLVLSPLYLAWLLVWTACALIILLVAGIARMAGRR